MRAAGVLLVAVGCHPVVPFDPPPAPQEGARAAIVLFEGADDLEAFAFDLVGAEPLARPFTVVGDPKVTILYLAHDLAAASIEPGRIPAASTGPVRSLPDFISAFERGPSGDWTPLEALPEPLAAFRLSGFDVTECASRGGCYRTEEQAAREDCRLPCMPAPPAPAAPPAPPEAPRFEPCPDRWTERELEGAIVCDPPSRVSCTAGMIQRIDDPSCAAVGPACPDGLFAEGLADPVVYVNAGDSLQAAAAAAQPGTTLALSKGTHVAGLALTKDVAFVGACVSETILTVPSESVGIDVGSGDVRLAGLTLRAGATAARTRGGALTLDGVLIEESTSAAISGESGSILVRDSLVRSVSGPALLASDTAVEVVDSVVADLDTPLAAFTLDAGSSGRMEDVVVEETTSGGLYLAGADLQIQRVLLDGLISVRAVEVVEASSLTADLLLIRDVTGPATEPDSHAVFVDGAEATLTRLLLERVSQHGLVVENATADVADTVIHTVVAPSPTRTNRVFGQGIHLSRASVGLTRTWVHELSWAGIRVLETTLAASDLVVDGVARSRSGMRSGVDISGSTVDIARLAAAHVDGESVSLRNSEGTLQDVQLEQDGDAPDLLGFECGLSVSGQSDVTVTRLRSERLRRKGACVRQGMLRATDYIALDVADHAFYLIDQGRATLERATLDGAADGLVAFERTDLTASDITIRNMHGQVTHVPETMLGFPRGRGIFNNAMARIQVERFVVTDCEDAGLDVSGRDSVRFFDGLVTRNLIGARLTFEPKHLLLGLMMSGNEIDFSRN